MFECYKWDIQSEDHSVLAPYPIYLKESEWQNLVTFSRTLSREAMDAERELLQRPELHDVLGLPNQIRKILKNAPESNSCAQAPRIMRFDFHFTQDGWRISEVNADVPGGFIEASGFARIIAKHYSEDPPPDPAGALATAIHELVRQGALVGMVHATAHSDDYQVMRYVADRIQEFGIHTALIGPEHLRWESGVARIECRFASGKPDLLVRFYPAEWLPRLSYFSQWKFYFAGNRTPISNPGYSLLLQSKRFPLVWDDLRTPLPTWRTLLPGTYDPRVVNADIAADLVYKPNFGRVGEDVAMEGVTENGAYLRILSRATRHPKSWVAQRRFEAIPLESEYGPRFVCVGVFALNGEVAGAYGRIASKPVIDHEAQDVAILIPRRNNLVQ